MNRWRKPFGCKMKTLTGMRGAALTWQLTSSQPLARPQPLARRPLGFRIRWKVFGFKPQALRKTLRNATQTRNGWWSFCRQALEMQPTLQLVPPLELAPPLDLSPRLVQGAPAADRPRMVGPATLALAAAESATPIAHAWRSTSGTRRAPHGRLAARGSAPCAKVASVISPGVTRKLTAAAVARFQMTPRSAPFGISVQKSGQARTPARQAPTLEECEATCKAPWPSKAGLTAECVRWTETTPAQETGMTVQDGERLRLHPYSPSGRNGYKKRKGSINRTKSGKGTPGIG